MLNLFQTNPSVTINVNSNTTLENYRDNVLKTNLPILTANDKVTGHLDVTPPPGKAVSHKGIILQVIGEFRRTDGEVINRFYTKKQELVPAGELRTPISNDFTFDNVNFSTGTFFGSAINVVWSVQLVVVHTLVDFKQETQFTVVLFDKRPASTEVQPIHNEVGIKNVLHIEFVFPSPKIDCTDAMVGSVYFILIKLRIIHMALTLYRVENYSSDDVFIKKKTELKTIEIMDGAPVRGDSIPIRFYIGEAGIWPFTPFKGSHLKVEHYVRAHLTDENGKKYFKRLKVEFGRFMPSEYK